MNITQLEKKTMFIKINIFASFRYVTELGEIETTPWMGWTDMVGTEMIKWCWHPKEAY